MNDIDIVRSNPIILPHAPHIDRNPHNIPASSRLSVSYTTYTAHNQTALDSSQTPTHEKHIISTSLPPWENPPYLMSPNSGQAPTNPSPTSMKTFLSPARCKLPLPPSLHTHARSQKNSTRQTHPLEIPISHPLATIEYLPIPPPPNHATLSLSRHT